MSEITTFPEAPPEAAKPRFGRKLYIVMGLVTIAIVAAASVVVFTQFWLGAKGEAVNLGFNYSVGEKMTYEISMIMKAMGLDISQEGTLEIEVLSFDGENYTIRQTMTLAGQESSSTVKMNRMGHILEYTGLPEFGETLSSFIGAPGFGLYFPEETIRLGESWTIPIDMEVAEMNLEGKISHKLSKITTVTVPAGTYEALKMETKGSYLQATSFMGGTGIHIALNINGYAYLENATCRLIEYSLHQSATSTTMGQTQSVEMTMQMQLIEHTG